MSNGTLFHSLLTMPTNGVSNVTAVITASNDDGRMANTSQTVVIYIQVKHVIHNQSEKW